MQDQILLGSILNDQSLRYLFN